ncbi:hypothetical protein CLOSTMETH_03252 [[Clostridium] methylpentosum DSM 5476]|uniref:Uncharacterized protein n=1 Tax=[Clostridium] methylpentosum DSM 5476 TaxID=537013 RepID=C0EH52_9FIRM|nr:hypothetical protein CLOSTMETH_03252 [[Clostridium] methylpentosum DSM 5476]
MDRKGIRTCSEQDAARSAVDFEACCTSGSSVLPWKRCEHSG